MSSIGGLAVPASVSVTTSATNPHLYTVTFNGSLGQSNQPPIAGVTAPGVTVTVSIVQGLSDPAASLTKVGAGTVLFPNANTYTGKTYVNAGILNIGNAGSLGVINSPEVQALTVLGPSGTFTLAFNGSAQSVPVNINSPTLAADIAAALNGLSTIAPNTVTVTVPNPLTSPKAFLITFGGSLTDFNLPLITTTPQAGVTATISAVQDGPEGTVVNAGGSLQVQGGITVANEHLTLNGTGAAAVQAR